MPPYPVFEYDFIEFVGYMMIGTPPGWVPGISLVRDPYWREHPKWYDMFTPWGLSKPRKKMPSLSWVSNLTILGARHFKHASLNKHAALGGFHFSSRRRHCLDVKPFGLVVVRMEPFPYAANPLTSTLQQNILITVYSPRTAMKSTIGRSLMSRSFTAGIRWSPTMSILTNSGAWITMEVVHLGDTFF